METPPPPPPPASAPPPPPPPPSTLSGSIVPTGGDYPARLDLDMPDKVARWRPLFNWVLAIPHFIVIYVLNAVSGVVALISWFVIVFTGKLPEGLATFQCMIQRYSHRVWAFVDGLVEVYPPFEFATTADDPTTYPARIHFQLALENRNRLTVALRLIWMIPAAIITFLILIVAALCWLIGAFVVLFTGSWPEGLRSWVVKGIRASLRLSAYQYLLTDEYPPLNFD